MIVYRCKACGEDHPAPLQLHTKLALNLTPHFAERAFHCPKAPQKEAQYSKDDLRWKDED